MQRSLWVLVNIALLLALVVVLLGGWTRLNYAGLSCPDWPGCFGSLVPPSAAESMQQAQTDFPGHIIDTHKGWLEMIHRYAAGTLGLLILGIALLSYKMRKIQVTPSNLPALLLVLVIIQALFGMWTVTLKLLPPIVTLHLLGGLLTLTLLFTLRAQLQRTAKISMSSRPPSATSNRPLNPWLRYQILAGVCLLFIQLALGGWTSSNYAGWACSDWFFCHQEKNISLDFARGFQLIGELKNNSTANFETSIQSNTHTNYEGGLLPLEARAAIQMTHRFVALVLISYIIWLWWTIRRQTTAFNRPIQLVLFLSITQAGLGIANIIWAVPLPLATAHHAGAVALLLAMLWLYQRSISFFQCSTNIQQCSTGLSQEVTHGTI
ncbi:COX15/CtaA family protein [Neptunomonas antarctica]|uniref:Cytochrome c oxidase assembly protein subunit 15 n=1 Tax=Neptunomonas antarctica TaxID=619304 RepID=A0A1N7J1U3_9GAMM|nr:COX15/CtaA family protein [Neptunomonas antarctica]SIS43348.1 cytochrome c oxidase assembly protein subunit 15 [Neptunomonas antarctica]